MQKTKMSGRGPQPLRPTLRPGDCLRGGRRRPPLPRVYRRRSPTYRYSAPYRQDVSAPSVPNRRPQSTRRPQGRAVASRPSQYEEVRGAPPQEMRLRSRAGAFWWVAVALAAAAFAYFLYRREIVLGAALSKLFHAATPPTPAPKATSTDLVDVSVFGPTAVQAGDECLIQVFLHQLNQREIADALAREVDPEATRRGIQTLAAEVARGQRVEIIFEGRGLRIDGERQSIIWRGEPCACQFLVPAAKDLAGRTFHPRVLVLVDSVPMGSVTFTLKVTKGQTSAESEPRGDGLRTAEKRHRACACRRYSFSSRYRPLRSGDVGHAVSVR